MTDTADTDRRRLRIVGLAAAGALVLTGSVAVTGALATTAAAGRATPAPGATGWPGGAGMGGGMGTGPGGGFGGGMGGAGLGPDTGAARGTAGSWGTSTCTAPAATGQVVRIAAMDMGGRMMGGSMMRLMPMWTRAAAGTVTIDLVNLGSRPHELLVYRLGDGQVAGQRSVGTDDRVSEKGVLGEVEPVCDQPSSVDGIEAGNTARVTLKLDPGRYELVCNLPGHYRSGMYATLVVA